MQNHDDMCLMNHLTEESILDNLVLRYHKDQIYTCIGPTLISVNPYKNIPTLYSPEIVQQVKDSVFSGNSLKMPHIYAIAGRAFQGMINQIEKQAIIISGQSGAGKTESTKFCMQMLTDLSQFEAEYHPISNKILACNPILEAFGNSKTVRNENSSRFGKYMQIYFGPDHTIKGANVKSYLLQKSRVTNVASKERSFHIFYALCASKMPGVKAASAYNFLKQSDCFTAAGINDQQFFEKVKTAMNELGFSEEEQQKIWKVLIAILELGNLQFNDKERQKNESLPCDITKEKQVLPQLAEALGVTSEQLKKMLLFSTIQIPRQQPILKPMDKSDCKANLHTLCKAIYNSLFDWILTKLQTVLNPPLDMEQFYRNFRSSFKFSMQEAPPPVRFEINILDIFGFQNFSQNSLQQLCINYTNQKLLDLYNRCVFDNQLAILRQDGLENQIDNIQPPSNDASVSLLDAVFRIIKDNTRIKHMKDQDIVSEFKANRVNNGHVKNITYDKFDENIFIIQHSPCQVAYNVTGFKMKNQDKLTPQIQNITTNLFQVQKAATSGRTLLEKFTNEINTLTTELQTAANHYVRCLKPNEEKKNEVVSEFIMRQIRYMGVFETIQIRKRIFPYRKTYEQMAYLFEQIFKNSKGKAPRAAVDIILAEIKAKPVMYLLGTRRIYMSETLEQQLNKKLIEFDKIRIDNANKIKRYYRRMKGRENFRRCVYSVIDRIKVLKKWGKEAQKLMFCCFRQIAERAENVRQKQLEESHMELRQSLVQIQELQNSQINEQIQFLRSSCRLINNPLPQMKKQHDPQNTTLETPSKKLQLSNISSPENNKKSGAQAELIRDLQQKNSQLLSQIQEQKHKQSEYESNLQQAQETINNQTLIIQQYEETSKNKEEQCNYLKDQLTNKEIQCKQLTLKLQQVQKKLTQIEDHHSPASIKERIHKINQLRQPPEANSMNQWQSVQAELKSLQNQHEKKQQQLQTVNRQSTSKQRELEAMIKELESIVASHKEKSGDLESKVEGLNQKLYKKCLDYEDLLKKHHEEQKKLQEYKNFQKMKNVDKNTIEKLRNSLSVLEKENKDLKDRVDQLIVQSQQYRKVVEGLKTNLVESSRINFDTKISTESGQLRPITQQQLFNQIHAYKIGKSPAQLQTLKQKICYILP